MKKIIFICLLLAVFTGCGTKANDNQQLINEMQAVAIQHLKQEYDIEYVIESYKFLPKHVAPIISFSGHSKKNPNITYRVGVDYEDKMVELVSHYDNNN